MRTFLNKNVLENRAYNRRISSGNIVGDL